MGAGLLSRQPRKTSGATFGNCAPETTTLGLEMQKVPEKLHDSCKSHTRPIPGPKFGTSRAVDPVRKDKI